MNVRWSLQLSFFIGQIKTASMCVCVNVFHFQIKVLDGWWIIRLNSEYIQLMLIHVIIIDTIE